MEGDSTKQVCNKLNAQLEQLEKSECTIYKVHRHLREVNPKAYEPEILAIGPYHRHKDDLKMMEAHKLRYFSLLLQRIRKDDGSSQVEKFVSTIAPLESKARKCYAEPIILKSGEFIQMLILDGCFIIEFVYKYYSGRRNNDPIFDLPWIFNSLVRDLVLFENQIPFFVLNELSQVVFEVANQHHKFMTKLLEVIFDKTYPLKEKISSPDVSWNDIKHLLDLMYRTWCPAPPSNSTEEAMPEFIESAEIEFIESAETEFIESAEIEFIESAETESIESAETEFIESATRLEEANVKFKRSKENENVNLFKVEFKNGTILMPRLIIEDKTESLFRNLIAYEQYFIKSPNSITYMWDYILFLDSLVDSSKDIGILCRNGIIVNWLGDEEVVAKMVNKLGDSVSGSENIMYSEIFDRVNKHCKKRRNRWMAKLRRNYLNSPWAIISIVAASVLLVLTLIQTVFVILQGV